MIPLSKIQVSPVKEKQFEKKHITCVEELATFFPRKYQDFRTKKKIKDLMDGDVCRIDGVVTHIYDNAKFSLQLDDGSGYIYITWFGGCFFKDSFERGALWTFCGKISFYNGQQSQSLCDGCNRKLDREGRRGQGQGADGAGRRLPGDAPAIQRGLLEKGQPPNELRADIRLLRGPVQASPE